MIEAEVIIAELQEAIDSIQQKHNVVVILREVDVFDAEYAAKHGIPRTRPEKEVKP